MSALQYKQRWEKEDEEDAEVKTGLLPSRYQHCFIDSHGSDDAVVFDFSVMCPL